MHDYKPTLLLGCVWHNLQDVTRCYKY